MTRQTEKHLHVVIKMILKLDTVNSVSEVKCLGISETDYISLSEVQTMFPSERIVCGFVLSTLTAADPNSKFAEYTEYIDVKEYHDTTEGEVTMGYLWYEYYGNAIKKWEKKKKLTNYIDKL